MPRIGKTNSIWPRKLGTTATPARSTFDDKDDSLSRQTGFRVASLLWVGETVYAVTEIH